MDSSSLCELSVYDYEAVAVALATKEEVDQALNEVMAAVKDASIAATAEEATAAVSLAQEALGRMKEAADRVYASAPEARVTTTTEQAVMAGDRAVKKV